jgi:hypothetical protein
MENVGTYRLRPVGTIFDNLYGRLVCIVFGHLVYFFPFWYVWAKKNLATLIEAVVLLTRQFRG